MGQQLTDEIRAHIKAQLTAQPTPASRPNKQRRTNAGLWVKPFHSDSLGCAPDQVEETIAHLRANGVMADFDKQGRCIITSNKQFREVAKASGLYDGRDGYGTRDDEGQKIMTGREQGEGQRRLKEELRKELRGYPSEYTGPLTREV